VYGCAPRACCSAEPPPLLAATSFPSQSAIFVYRWANARSAPE
jgi:hypothetical protein